MIGTVPAYNAFYEKLVRNSLQITGGANVQTVDFGGDKVDADQDDKVDKALSPMTCSASADFMYTVSQAFGFTASFHFARKRATAVKDQILVSYRGLSIASGIRVAVLNPEYRSTSDYLNRSLCRRLSLAERWSSNPAAPRLLLSAKRASEGRRPLRPLSISRPRRRCSSSSASGFPSSTSC
jgi:hypothetical protein